MKSSLRVDDRKWRQIKAMLPEIANASVKVGIQSDAGEQDGTPIAQYAFINEFGGPKIPERSFLRSTIDENRAAYGQFIDVRLGRILTIEIDAPTAFKQLGLKVEGDIKQKIINGPFTPNDPATIRIKGSSSPLNDTGTMRNSVRYVVEGI